MQAETVVADLRVATGGAAARVVSVPALASQIFEDRSAAIMAGVTEPVGESLADLGRRVLADAAISGVTAAASAAVDQAGGDRAVSAVRLLSAGDADSVIRWDVGDKTVGAVHRIAVSLASAAIADLVGRAALADPADSAAMMERDEAIVISVVGRGLPDSTASADREVPDAMASGPVLAEAWEAAIGWVNAD